MAILPEDINANISPKEFEIWVRDHLNSFDRKLTSFQATHNVIIPAPDGEYQIDVLVEFEVMGATFKTLIECKRYRGKKQIERAVVQLLYDKIRATGAHKGMIFATTGFQKGAMEFATAHGIALVRVIEGKYTFETKGYENANFQPPPWIEISKYVGKCKIGNATFTIDVGYLEPIQEFLFGN
jgi:restriction system protein